MAHAEICLICCGSGKLPNDGKTTDASPKLCHGCGGLGWVSVQDSGSEVDWRHHNMLSDSERPIELVVDR